MARATPATSMTPSPGWRCSAPRRRSPNCCGSRGGTVGPIITRVQDDIDATVDRLGGLRRIGIDEISWKRNHRYLTVVVDHDTRRLVWAGVGRNEATLRGFFDRLGAE